MYFSAGDFLREDAGYFLYDRRPPQGNIPVFTREDFASVLLEHFVRFELREIFVEAGIIEGADAIGDVEDVERLAPQLFDFLVPQVRNFDCMRLESFYENSLLGCERNFQGA